MVEKPAVSFIELKKEDSQPTCFCNQHKKLKWLNFYVLLFVTVFISLVNMLHALSLSHIMHCWAHWQFRSRGKSFSHLPVSVQPLSFGLVRILLETFSTWSRDPTPGRTPSHILLGRKTAKSCLLTTSSYDLLRSWLLWLKMRYLKISFFHETQITGKHLNRIGKNSLLPWKRFVWRRWQSYFSKWTKLNGLSNLNK